MGYNFQTPTVWVTPVFSASAFSANVFRKFVAPATYDATSKTNLRNALTAAAAAGDTVCAVGDSITYDTDYDDVVFARYPGVVVSADMGVPGDTSKGVLKRLETILGTSADLYLVGIGVNDIRINTAVGATTITEFIDDMRELINNLKANADVYIVSIWPTFSPDTGSAFNAATTNSMIDERNTALRELCFNMDIPFINATEGIRTAIDTAEKVTQYVPDGIHPNADGREIYADNVLS